MVMASYHLHDELDSSNPGSVSSSSSPRFDYHYSRQHTTHDLHAQVRLICSFGGKISPRVHDNRLCYVGGDTRIIAVHRATTFSTLLAKLSKLSGMLSGNIYVKYQLPYEDLDTLISVSNDEDVENMFIEYDPFAYNQNPEPVRLRLFLFNKCEQNRPTNTGSIHHGLAHPEQCLLDTLSGNEPAYATRLKPTRSDAASFFGLDNNDKVRFSGSKWKTLSKLSDSDPRTLDPASVTYVSSLPHEKIRPENPSRSTKYEEDQSSYFMETVTGRVPQLGGHAPISHHFESTGQPEQIYYFIMDPIEANNACIVASVPIGVPCLIPYSSSSGQIPFFGYHQSVSAIDPAYNPITRSIRDLDPSNEPDDGLNRGGHLYN